MAANSDGAQAGSSDCAMGMGNRSAEFSWDWAWSTGNRPGGMGRTRLGNGPAGMGNGSGIGAVMADMAGGSTEGTGSGGIMDFSGAARGGGWARASGTDVVGRCRARVGIGDGSGYGTQAGNSSCGMDTGSDLAASGRLQGTGCGAEAEVAGVVSKMGTSATMGNSVNRTGKLTRSQVAAGNEAEAVSRVSVVQQERATAVMAAQRDTDWQWQGPNHGGSGRH